MSENYQKIDTIASLTPYERWQSEIQAAEKELDRWQRNARKIVKNFRAERIDASGIDANFERRFNLFTANTQIMQSALLNQLPMPSVEREFKDENDDVGRVASLILERALEYQVRKDTRMYDIITNVVQDNLVPGVGLSWHTYQADIESKTEEPDEATLAANPQAAPIDYDEVVGEEIVDEYVYWEDILWSPARCWEEVRWLARKTYLTRDQLIERFGEEKGKEVALDYAPKKNDARVETKNQVFQQGCIYEIWSKEEEKVYWFSKGYDELLDEKDNFLELPGFYPCPKPLFATISNGQLIPIPDYEYARDQYRELNEINTRIALLVRACRVAGVYDKSAGAVTSLLSNAAENTLVPVDTWAAMAEKGGIKGVIDWIPLDQIIKTIEQLLKAREDVKQQIYEVTGMSDIIRGASKASETLGAQKIKAQYASMRIQTRQKNVAIYASQVFAIQADLIRIHMDPQKIAELSQAAYLQEDPQLIIQALTLLKSKDFALRVQVESDTLSDIDFQAERDSRMEYLTTINQFMKDSGQAMLNDPVIGPFLAQLLQFSLVGFRVGKKFEGRLDKTIQKIQEKLANPPPPQPTPEQQKVQAEMQLMQQEGQMKAQEGQMKAQEGQQQLQLKQQLAQLELQVEEKKAQLELQIEQQKMQMEQAKFQQEIRQDQIKAQIEVQQAEVQSRMQIQQAAIQGQIAAKSGQQRLQQDQATHTQKLKQEASRPKPSVQ